MCVCVCVCAVNMGRLCVCAIKNIRGSEPYKSPSIHYHTASQYRNVLGHPHHDHHIMTIAVITIVIRVN